MKTKKDYFTNKQLIIYITDTLGGKLRTSDPINYYAIRTKGGGNIRVFTSKLRQGSRGWIILYTRDKRITFEDHINNTIATKVSTRTIFSKTKKFSDTARLLFELYHDNIGCVHRNNSLHDDDKMPYT